MDIQKYLSQEAGVMEDKKIGELTNAINGLTAEIASLRKIIDGDSCMLEGMLVQLIDSIDSVTMTLKNK